MVLLTVRTRGMIDHGKFYLPCTCSIARYEGMQKMLCAHGQYWRNSCYLPCASECSKFQQST